MRQRQDEGWSRVSRVRVLHPTDLVVARTRAQQTVGLFGDFALSRSRFGAAVSEVARQVLDHGHGYVVLEARAGRPSVRAVISAGRQWRPVLEGLDELVHLRHEKHHVVLTLDLPERAEPLDPVVLQRAGAYLARVGVDVSGRAEVVDQNRSLHEALGSLERESRRVAELAARLRGANDQLERRNDDLELFANATAHDLREPLIAVELHTRLLRSLLQRGDTEAAARSVDLVADSAAHALAMLEGLSTYGRVEHLASAAEEGEESFTADPVVVGQRVLAALAGRLEASGGTVHLPEGMPLVRLRPDLLAQILQNLVGNALKYHRPGVPPEVWVRGGRVPDGVQIEVADNGRGLPEDAFDRVFTLFQRVHTDVEGTGVGLALVARIVRGAGGRVELSSELGVGSRFRVVLPAAS